MQKSLFGRTLLHDLGFLTPLSRIMGSNLTAKPSGDIVVNWTLEIDIQL